MDLIISFHLELVSNESAEVSSIIVGVCRVLQKPSTSPYSLTAFPWSYCNTHRLTSCQMRENYVLYIKSLIAVNAYLLNEAYRL